MADGNSTTPIEYREIIRFPGYRFGDDGTVWSRWIRKSLGQGKGSQSILGTEWRQLRPILTHNRQGYWHQLVNLRRRHCKIHSLILEAFIGPRPPGLECRHLDGNSMNNRLDNLCWGTQRENMADRVRHGTDGRGEKNGSAKLTAGLILAIRFAAKHGWSQQKIGERLGVSQTNVGFILRGKTWKHVR
jgi:hypothetical protein